jgi:ABC-type sugar transport system ATPase subunit
MERGLVLVSEDRRRDQAFLGRDLAENITAPALDGFASRALGWLDQRAEQRAAADVVRRYTVQPARLDNTMARLSGGNQQKAIIGRWLANRPKVCILDEPTKGIDIGARATVHRLFAELAGEGIGFILISSDIPELLALSHRIIVLRKGRLVGALDREEFEADRVLAIASTGVQQ